MCTDVQSNSYTCTVRSTEKKVEYDQIFMKVYAHTYIEEIKLWKLKIGEIQKKILLPK